MTAGISNQPAGMIYNFNGHYLYYFSQQSSYLYLTIFDCTVNLVFNEYLVLDSTVPTSAYDETLITIERNSGNSLVWIANKKDGTIVPLYIHIKID
jgi:hypothetical protein